MFAIKRILHNNPVPIIDLDQVQGAKLNDETGFEEMKFDRQRRRMVTQHLQKRGVHDPLVLDAMGKVQREQFVPTALRPCAYADRPLPIGKGQTISQPYIVAFMVEAMQLTGGERVLDVGAGSGYSTAILAEIAAEVYAVERLPDLEQAAAKRLRELGYANVCMRQSDGTEGWKEFAPYDAILVSACAAQVPQPLVDQLKPGGRLVIPVKRTVYAQKLLRIIRTTPDDVTQEVLADVAFVDLIGGQ